MSIRTTRARFLSSLMCLAAFSSALAAPTGNPGAGPTQPATAATPLAQQPGSRTALGDLSSFRAIATDTLKIVSAGDFDAAKKRIKDLELSWDQAEPKLKPLASEKWRTVDVAIDHALKEVRAWRATQEGSSEALKALITTIDTLK